MHFQALRDETFNLKLTLLLCELFIELLPGYDRKVAVLAVLLLVGSGLLLEKKVEFLLAESLPQLLGLVGLENVRGVGLNNLEKAGGRNTAENIHDFVDW